MFITFQFVLFTVLAGIQYVFFRKVRRHLRQKPPFARIAARGIFLSATLSLAAVFLWPVGQVPLPGWVMAGLLYPLVLWHFSSFLLFLAMVIGKILKVPLLSMVWLFSKFERTERWIYSLRARQETRYNAQRRVFMQQGITIMAGAAFAGGSAYGAFRRNHYELGEETIPITGLPAEFQGFTIALVSDIHSSVFMTREQMKHYVRAVNALGADLIAVTGDFVNGALEEVYPFAEAFSDLRAPSGVYGVLGNHDYYTRRVDAVAREVNDCGITLLRNERVEIRRGGSRIHLLGVDDTGSAQRAAGYVDGALQGAGAGTPKVLLCHRPYFFQEVAARKIDLTLSGHTHGGQIVLARIGKDVFAPARIASPYVAGLYTIEDSRMYVSRGIGTVGVPIRVNCPAEITKLTLVSREGPIPKAA